MSSRQDADVIEAEDRAKDLEEAVLRLRLTPSSSYVGTPKATPDLVLPEPGTVIEGDIRRSVDACHSAEGSVQGHADTQGCGQPIQG